MTPDAEQPTQEAAGVSRVHREILAELAATLKYRSPSRYRALRALMDAADYGAAAMLAEFHAEADHPDTNALWLRPTLHEEEHRELIEALRDWEADTMQQCESDPVLKGAVARELADVVYVAYGTALVAGIDLDAALREVHRANMHKAREGHRREDGKVMKPPGFRPPDMSVAIAPEGEDG